MPRGEKKFSLIFVCLLMMQTLVLFSADEVASSQPPASHEETFEIVMRELEVVTPIQVKCRTAESVKIGTPVWWQPIRTIVEDGSNVKKGDVVATFEKSQLEYELMQKRLQKRSDTIWLNKRLTDIDNRNTDMNERMGELEDRLAALESKLARQKNEPTADDILIEEGRLRIARMNRKASEKEFSKAKNRFARGMISRAELETYEKSWKEDIVKEEYAEICLDLAKNPPDRPKILQATELEIANAKLEIERYHEEMVDQQKIGEIQKSNQLSRSERIVRKIEEYEQYLRHVSVYAPADGIASKNLYGGNEIVEGVRMWLNYVFLELPDLKTICFKGMLPEASRPFHKEGDLVNIRVNGKRQILLKGVLKGISTLSHDLSEREDAGSNNNKSFGMKVFDVDIELKSKAEWLRPGVFGEGELVAATKIKGAAVPLRFLREREGKRYISLNGVYQEVAGNAIGNWFLLEDSRLLGRVITLRGRYSDEKNAAAAKEMKKKFSLLGEKTQEKAPAKPVKQEKKREEDARLSATGELIPIRSTNIRVGDIGNWPWPKITWLLPEETVVKKGDLVAELDPKEREKQLIEYEATFIERTGNLQEMKKQQEITRRQGYYNVKIAENKMKIVQLHSALVLDYIPPAPVALADKNLKLAQIAYDFQKKKVEREDARERPTMSPAELRKMKRTLVRYRLKVEQAQLKLEVAKEGATEVERLKAKLNLLDAEDGLLEAREQAEYNNKSRQREVLNRQRSLYYAQRNMNYTKKRMQNHKIYAPEDGILCYNKVYYNGAYAKVAVGNTVGPRFSILSIPDLSDMEIKVELDEKYYTAIKQGDPVEVRLPSLGDMMISGEVSSVELLFTNRGKKDKQIGIYSSHEPLGQVVFHVHIRLKPAKNVMLKPGLVGEVYFSIPR